MLIVHSQIHYTLYHNNNNTVIQVIKIGVIPGKSSCPGTRLRTPSPCSGCRRPPRPWPCTLRGGRPGKVSILFRRCTRTWWTTAPRPSTFSCGRRTVSSRVSSAARTCWPSTWPRSPTRRSPRSWSSRTSRCSTDCWGYCCRSAPTCSASRSTGGCCRWCFGRCLARCAVSRSGGVWTADRTRYSR